MVATLTIIRTLYLIGVQVYWSFVHKRREEED